MIYKIANLLLDNSKKSLIIAVLCICSLTELITENPCTESLSLPFILISLYYFVRFTLNKKDFTWKESLLTGICFAVVLLLRVNIATLWIIYYIYLFVKLIKEKEIKHLLYIIGFSIIGVILVFLPVILYLVNNGALKDFIDSYLIFNLIYTSEIKGNILEVVNYFISQKYIIALVAILYIFLICIKRKLNKKENELIIVNFIYFLFTFYIIIFPQRGYLHYLITMLPTLIVPISISLKYIEMKKKHVIIILGILLLYLLFWQIIINIKLENSHNVQFNKNISKKVQQLTRKEDNVVVLGNRAIIYLLSERDYRGKYLYQPSIVNINREYTEKIINDIKTNLPDAIVFLWNTEETTEFKIEIQEILDEMYITEDDVIFIIDKEE